MHEPESACASPLVSIVIPCYNQARYLVEAIASARAQTHVHREIIVVDDGSNDDTSAVAAAYPDLRCIRQANAGLSAARNRGLHASRGEYLVFLDADDRLLPHAVEAGLACFRHHPDGVLVAGEYRFINADGSFRAQYAREPFASDPYTALLQNNFIGMHATVMYRRRILDEVGGFDPALTACEDYDLYLRIALSHSICCHDTLVAEYRVHDASMSTDPARMLRAALAVLGAQWPHVAGDPVRVRALRNGIRYIRHNVRWPLMTHLGTSLRTGRWVIAMELCRRLGRYAAPWTRAAWLDMRLSARLLFARPVHPGLP